MSYRCIVTGHSAEGRSCVISDGSTIASSTLGIADFWKTAAPPVSIHSPSLPIDEPLLLPPASGTIFRFFEIPRAPAGASPEELRALATEQFASAGATHCQADTRLHPMMHRTDTIDYVVLLRGEVTLILDDGEVELKPFDAVVQRGTNHYWVNRASEPALFAAVLLDATR